MATLRLIESEVPRKIIWGTVRGFFFPVYAIAASAKWLTLRGASREAWKALPSDARYLIRRDAPSLMLYLSLLFGSMSVSISHAEMDHSLGQDLDSQPGHTVVVNGFKPDDPLYEFANHRFAHRVSGDKTILYASSWDDMQKKIEHVVEQHGAIQTLEIHGHGIPGMITLQRDVNSGANIRAAARNKPTVHRLKISDHRWFKENANVNLYACEAGCGVEGDALYDAIGESLLLAHGMGGTVSGPTVPIHTSPAFPLVQRFERQVPHLRYAEDLVSRGLVGVHAIKAFSGIETSDDLPIPHFNRMKSRHYPAP